MGGKYGLRGVSGWELGKGTAELYNMLVGATDLDISKVNNVHLRDVQVSGTEHGQRVGVLPLGSSD